MNSNSQFNEDDIERLTFDLQNGKPGSKFTAAELDFIASWGGDDFEGTFYNERIRRAYQIPDGFNTWPHLVELLREIR